jgi:hypothetical protein
MLRMRMKPHTLDVTLPMWVLGCNPSGPYSVDQVRAMWLAGNLKPDQQYCQQGMKTWCPLSDIVATLDGTPAPPPAEPVKVIPIPLRPPPLRRSGRPAMTPSDTSFERGYSYPHARRTLRFRNHL